MSPGGLRTSLVPGVAGRKPSRALAGNYEMRRSRVGPWLAEARRSPLSCVCTPGARGSVCANASQELPDSPPGSAGQGGSWGLMWSSAPGPPLPTVLMRPPPRTVNLDTLGPCPLEHRDTQRSIKVPSIKWVNSPSTQVVGKTHAPCTVLVRSSGQAAPRMLRLPQQVESSTARHTPLPKDSP